MKQFLRHIFLLLALFVATANLYAQTYNGGTWYSLYDTEQKNNTTVATNFCEKAVFAPADNMTFQYIKYSWASINGKVEVYNKLNGSDWGSSKGSVSYSDHKNWKTSGVIALDANISHIRYRMPSGTGASVRNHFVKLKKHILLNDNTTNGQTWGVSSITLTDNSLATAEGKTSSNYYTIKFRSFLASDNITVKSNNSEFHFGNGATSISLNTANNYFARIGGTASKSSTNPADHRNVNEYETKVYFSPSVQHNKNTRSTTITISDGTSTAYIYLSAPVIPTYFFKAEAISSPAEGGTATATFANGKNTYSIIAPDYATGSQSTTVTFTAAPKTADGYVFEGWKKDPANATFHKQGADKTTITETITSSALNPNGLASQLTLYAIYSRRYTAKITGSNYSGKLVNDSWQADYQFVNTQTAIPTNSEADPFYFKIEHNFTGNDTREGSSRPDEVIAYDPTTNTITALNEGTATITFYQKNTSSHEPVTESFTVQVIKYTPKFTWNANNITYYYGTSIPNIFSTTNPDCQYTIVSNNEHVAKVIGNTLHIYNVEETAKITVTQAENYKWNGKTGTYTITPVSQNNHVTFTINSENYYNVFRYDNTGNLSWTNNGVLLGSPDVGSGASNFDDRYYDIVFTGIPDKLSFTYERSTSIATDCDWYVKESVDGVTWSEKNVWKKGNSNSGSVEVSLNPTTRYLRFCYSGNYGGYFRNVKVTELEKFEADPNPLDFGTRPVGEGEQLLLLNFSHANAGRITTDTIIGKDAKYFTVTPTIIPGTGRDMSGTTHLNVTFANNGEDRGLTPYEATLVITDNAGHREEVQLTGVRHGKATPEFTWNPNNFPYYFNTSIANIVVSSNTDYANCPLTITSSNENIAKVENGRLYIYDQSGEVTFTVTQRGNDRYNEHTESFTFTPKAKPDLEVPFHVTQTIYSQAITVGDNCSWDGDDYHLKLGNGAWDDTRKTAILVFSGRPDKLTFTYATSYNLAVSEIGSFDNPKWEVEESSDGENWKSIWSVRTNSTSWADAEIPLSETTQYVRFSYDGNYAGYFKNINISELVGYKYLRAADGHYLSRGAKWGTQAVVDAFGVVSRLSRYTHDNENIYTRFFFVDNEQYMFETETEDEQRLHEVFTDHGTALNTNHLWQINDNGGIFTIQSANEVGEVSHKGNYITAVNGVLAFTTNESEATRWQMEDYTEHPQYITDMLNRQAAEAALRDFGNEINTLEKVRNRLREEDFEVHEITIPALTLGEQTGESRTVDGMPHIYEQTITGLDTGFYRLTIKALYRISNSEIAWKCHQEKGKESVLAYAYANNVQYPIQSVYASYHSSAIENTDELYNGKYYSTTLSSAAIAFNDANRYLNDVYVYVEADPGKTTGTLRYGIKSPSYVPGAWLAYSTITLTHFARKEYIFEGIDPENPTDWHTGGNWDRGSVPNQYHNVRINANAIISMPVNVYGITIDEDRCVNITSKGGLTVGNGGIVGAEENSITLDNTPEGAGFLRINPYAANKPQNVKVNYKTRTFNNGSPGNEVWQYIGMPGSDGKVDDLTGVTIYHWDETRGWIYQTEDALKSIPAWEGFAFTQSKEEGATFSIHVKPVFDMEREIDLTCTTTGSGMKGDNLFVNSYLAPIDVTQIDDNDIVDPDGNLTRTFFIFNSGSWNDWNSGKGDITASGYDPSSAGHYYSIPFHSAKFINDGVTQVVIPSMQGVYVYSSGDATIKFNYQKHVMGTSPIQDNLNTPLRAPQSEVENAFQRVRIQATSQNSGADRLYVIQEATTTDGYDNGYDGDNIMATGQVNIYTHEPFGEMEVSCSNNIDSTWIGFSAGEDTIYTLTFGALIGEELFIKDVDKDSLIHVSEGGQYTFYAQPNSKNDMRFQLLLNPELPSDEPEQEEDGVTTNIEDATTIQLWVSDKRLYINHAQPNSQLAIYNASGMLMATPYTLYSTPYTLDLSYLPIGVYVLRINNQAYKFVCE